MTVLKLFCLFSLFCLLAYGCAMTFMWRYQESFLFHVAAGPVADPATAGYPEYSIQAMHSPAGGLKFWAVAPMPGKPVIVHFHGSAGTGLDEARLFERYVQEGWGVVLTEYSGWTGNPGGPVSERTMRRDAGDYARWTAAKWPGHPVVAWGESLGTGIAVDFAVMVPALCVVLDAPYTSVADLAAAQYPWLPVRLMLRNPFDTMAILPRLHMPVMVIHGEADTLIPPSMGRRVVAALPNAAPPLFLAGVGHTALLAEPGKQAEDAVHAWLEFVMGE